MVFYQIKPGAKYAALRLHNHCANRIAAANPIEQRANLFDERRRQGIALVRAVQRDDCDICGNFDLHEITRGKIVYHYQSLSPFAALAQANLIWTIRWMRV